MYNFEKVEKSFRPSTMGLQIRVHESSIYLSKDVAELFKDNKVSLLIDKDMKAIKLVRDTNGFVMSKNRQIVKKVSKLLPMGFYNLEETTEDGLIFIYQLSNKN